MTPKNFCQKLKQLRGRITVEELARQRGVSGSSIYKCEQTAKVTWKTVEKAYGACFKDENEYLETLALWALAQASKPSSQTAVTDHVALATKTHRDLQRDTEIMTRLLNALKPPERALLVRFCELFSLSCATRTLAHAWLEGLAEKR